MKSRLSVTVHVMNIALGGGLAFPAVMLLVWALGKTSFAAVVIMLVASEAVFLLVGLAVIVGHAIRTRRLGLLRSKDGRPI